MMEQINHPASGLRKGISLVSRFLCRVASFVLFGMMCLTIADVLMRKLLSRSILGTLELTELLMLVVVFFTLSQTELLGGHIRVDLVAIHFSPRTQRAFDTVTQLCGSLLFGLMTFSGLKYATNMGESGAVTQDLWIPVYPFIYAMVLGCGLLALALFTGFLDSLKEKPHR